MQSEQVAISSTSIGPEVWRVRLAWLLVGATVMLAIGGASIHLLIERGDLRDTLGTVFVLASASTGGLIALRRPANNIGWLLLYSAFFQAGGYLAAQYGLYGAVFQPGAVPHPLAVAWLASVLTPIGTGLIVLVLPLLYPDGHVLSPGWRPITRAALVAMAVLITYNAFRPGNIQDQSGLPNPYALDFPQPWNSLALTISGIVLFSLFLIGAASMVVRYHRSAGDERLQLKWLTYAIIAWFITVLLATIAQQFSTELYIILDTLVMVVLAAIPIAIGIAVLRYRLYDIDLLINRTLVYAVLTASVAGLYALIVVSLGALLQAQGSPAIGLAAAGIVALLFAPLRDRLQRGVNRLLYGHRNEPYAALSRLGRRLDAALAPDEVLPIIVRTVAETLKLPYVAISLRSASSARALRHEGAELLADDGRKVAASFGDWPAVLVPEQLVAVALNYQGEEVGQLLLAKRRGSELFSAADQRLVADLARRAGAAAHTVQLTRDLQASLDEVRRSRNRLVTAQEEERRRIQRDLHDGLGPVLASMRLRLEACLDAAQAGPPDLARELERLHELVGQASTDIRRLVHDLRPPAIDQLGLVPALRQHIERFSRETGIAVELTTQPLTLAAAAEVAIFRIVQEALTNVYKHARAMHVSIRLGTLGEALLLEIRDDGVGGVGAGQGDSDGTGVASMHERAELLGGTLVMSSPPGAGTTVEAYLPLWRKRDE